MKENKTIVILMSPNDKMRPCAALAMIRDYSDEIMRIVDMLENHRDKFDQITRDILHSQMLRYVEVVKMLEPVVRN